jgi:hypothetical protein
MGPRRAATIRAVHRRAGRTTRRFAPKENNMNSLAGVMPSIARSQKSFEDAQMPWISRVFVT